MNIIFLIPLLLWSGCGLLDTENEADTEPEVNQYFRAELNGEPWKGPSSALLMDMHGLPWLSIVAGRIDTAQFPYRNEISFVVHFDSAKSDYNVLQQKEENSRSSGGVFTELDGDAIIGSYDPIPDSLNTFTINITEDEESNKFVTGTFAMKVVIREVYDDKEPNNSYRQYPDTVRITSGEFRVLLEEQE